MKTKLTLSLAACKIGDDFVATLKFTDGTVKRVEGKAGDGITLSGHASLRREMVQ